MKGNRSSNNDNSYFGANASLQIAHYRSQEIKIDKPKIKEFLDTIEYPINFFDFETFQNERFIDLAHPFQYKYYYHPKFNGKYSIKVVLPTLFPNNDELDYKKLGSIQNGGDAMDTFANLHLMFTEVVYLVFHQEVHDMF